MKLGEIKIEALKLMNADYTNAYTVAGLPDLLTDDNYGKYLRAMNESINRCFDRIKSLGKQPKKSLVIDKGNSTANWLFLDMTVAAYATVDGIVRISYYDENTGERTNNEPYEIEATTLILANRDGVYKMIYLEKLPYITTEADTAEIALAPELARLVPYFIKGELYEEDEPELASRARNMFESILATMYKEPEIRQTKVEDVFEGF